MPVYRIHRLKDAQREHFRRAPHVSGVTSVKAKDYEEAGSIEAPGLYAAWAALRESDRPLGVGDLLETETGDLVICKYVGFEQARWVLPEVKTGLDSTPPGFTTAQSPDGSMTRC